MVAPEYDGGVIGQFQTVERIEQHADLHVEERDGGVVGSNGLSALLHCHAPIGRFREICPLGSHAHLRFVERRSLDLLQREEVEVLRGSDPRNVRAVETCAYEEWLIA